MSEFKSMFYPELVELGIDAKSEKELFGRAAESLKTAKMVSEDYLSGITSREEKFPTGLITQYLNIAFPHSEPEYIKSPFVFVARLTSPVAVKQMGDSQNMEVKDFFFLGIKDGKKQSGLLASFMNLFMNEKFVEKYVAASTTNEVYDLFRNNI